MLFQTHKICGTQRKMFLMKYEGFLVPPLTAMLCNYHFDVSKVHNKFVKQIHIERFSPNVLKRHEPLNKFYVGFYSHINIHQLTN